MTIQQEHTQVREDNSAVHFVTLLAGIAIGGVGGILATLIVAYWVFVL